MKLKRCAIYGTITMEVLTTEEFDKWFYSLTLKERTQVDARIAKIEKYGHFSDWRNLGDGVAELKWKNGRRIYFSKVGKQVLLLLNGGFKNAQKKDIKKAKHILRRHADDET